MYMQEYSFDEAAGAGLTVYLHEEKPEFARVGKRPFILVIPGGGYSFCSEREAEPIALNFLAQGYHAGVLRYHVGEFRSFDASLQDAQEALAKITELSAGAWPSIDAKKIAVIGFSAGGHLAAALSTLSERKPSLCILGYPAILQSFAKVMQIKAPSLETCVTPETPPTFVFSTFEDNVVPIENSLLYLRALEENDVPFETHLFQKGKHGLSLATERFGNREEMVDPRFGRWFNECVEWMEINWAESSTGEMPAALVEWPIAALIKEPKNRALLVNSFPSWQEKSTFKIVKNFSLQQLTAIIPERFSQAQCDQLVAQLVDPRRGEIE
ncbi:alpha/beta hydrolase [Enterococcus gallinarum]|uniref:alpha/beta hydrolase n=1 Tax=Enterococcus gallinarum TaxID=1353 RepID=UPI00189A0A79|nr:alpha/beta hydrolase [Enterococcus gallinarum]MCR1942993.1 alpha/beta hydrolase [Enterococcus gallinarum]